MEIREVDRAELHEFYLAMQAASLADNPERMMWTEQAMTGYICEPTADQVVEAWGAFDGRAETGRIGGSGLVGGIVLFVPQLDNRDKAYSGVFVEPASQRRGIGSALIDTLIDRAREHGRTSILVESCYSFEDRADHGHLRFARRHGFEPASFEVVRRLHLPVPEERLQGWIDEAAPHHRDYRIETFDSVPDELLPSVCELSNQLAVDAPTGDIEFEAEQVTPEIRRAAEERDLRRGMQRRETVAIDRHGTAVATSAIGIPAGDPKRLQQWITIVGREHRGHRLGLAVKAANLQAVQRSFPERTAIFTSNHEDNAQMVAINEKMGFEPIELDVEFQLKLDA